MGGVINSKEFNKYREMVLELEPGVYTYEDIRNSTKLEIPLNDFRWLIYFLKKDNKVRTIKPGLFSINLTNNEFQKKLSNENKRYSITELLNKNLAFISYKTLLYKTNMLEGTQVNQHIYVNNKYKGKIIKDDLKEYRISYIKFSPNFTIGEEIFRRYISDIISISISELPLFINILNKYNLNYTDMINKKVIQTRKQKMIGTLFGLRENGIC